MNKKEKYNKTILLVEDEALISLSEAVALEARGYSVVKAYSGEKAVEECRNNPDIDLVLMDINLGKGINGVEAAARILDIKNLPVIFLSSHTEAEFVEKASSVTSYGYVLKTSGVDILHTTIKMAFKLFDANRNIEEQHRHLDTLLSSIGDAVISTDIDGKILRINPVAQNLTGWSASDAIGKDLSKVFKIINASSGEKIENPVDKVLSSGSIVGLGNHTVLISKDGKTYQISDSASPIIDDSGNISGVVLVFKDITEEYRIRENLRLSEEKFRAAFYTSPDAVNINAMDGRYVDINEGFIDLTGFTEEDVIGKLSSEINIWAIPEDRERLIKELGENGYVRNLESLFRCKDGSFKTALMSAEIIKLDGVPHILSITRDITEREKAEKELEGQKTRLSCILESSNIGTWEWNIITGETVLNERWAEILGYKLEDLKPTTIKTWEALTHPDDVKRTYEAIERHINGETDYYINEMRMKHKGGHWVWLLDRGRLISRTKEGKPLWMYGSHIVIDENKRMEKKLNESLEEVNVLLSELQHRVKNSFNLISSIIDLMRFDNKSDIVDSVLAELASRVKAVSEMYTVLYQSDSVNDIDMDAYIKKLVETIPLKNDIQFKFNTNSFKMPAKDAVSIGLITNELITNSIKYAFKDIENCKISIKLLKKKDKVIFEIYDNGTGIPDNINPATIKSMGMTLVYSLVQQISGDIVISNKNGTCVTITFPLDKISK